MRTRPPPMARLALGLLSSLVVLGTISGCKEAKSPPCRDDAADDVDVAGRTGVEGVKTGAKTAAEGAKTFGRATGGLFSGGKEEAKERWNEGKEETKKTAEEGAAKTKGQGRPRCH